MRKSNYLWLLLAAVCGTMLFHTSQQVTDGRTKLAGIEAKAEKEDETIRVLQAEWSYLNQPDRLEKLSRQYLTLEPLKGRQFGKIADLEARPVPDAPADAKPAGVAAVEENDNAAVKAPAVDTAAAAATEADKTDTAKADAGIPKADAVKDDGVKIDKASVTAGLASPVLGSKPAAAAKAPAVKPAAAKPAAAKPARGYVYSPPYKPRGTAPAQAATYYHPAPYQAPVATNSADSGRGFNDVMKSLGVH
ncbi:MAG: hypothetical protein PW788_10560 [Micavibrio sp.]|nr:hypothetical protein [Micavibrio sp.]